MFRVNKNMDYRWASAHLLAASAQAVWAEHLSRLRSSPNYQNKNKIKTFD